MCEAQGIGGDQVCVRFKGEGMDQGCVRLKGEGGPGGSHSGVCEAQGRGGDQVCEAQGRGRGPGV